VDLDLIYDPSSPEQTDKNLGLLIDRLTSLGVDTVFLQAFRDVDGTGNIRSVYFKNRALPVEADIFSHAVHQMIIRDLHVFAWMPTLSIVFPDTTFNQHYRVREYAQGGARPSESWYQRLTPFSPEVREKVRTLYEDLAAGSQIEGVLFQDDAYLTDHEDVHPLALKAFEEAVGHPVTIANLSADPELQARWSDFKTRALMDYLDYMKAGVRKFRPLAGFARNLYANVLVNPASQAWFAQNYEDFLKTYDYVVVMAYPQMEKAKKPLPWLQGLAEKALASPLAGNKTIFKLQTYDWNTGTWIEGDLLLREMRTALAAGIRHLAYYPDNLWEGEPAVNIVRLEMSTRNTPGVK
jgi:biofilm PGA synthesis lipoprotein PgaB